MAAKVLLALFDRMPKGVGIQHPPRRNSLGSSTTREGLGRSWETVYEPTLHPVTPQRMNVCRLPVRVSANSRGVLLQDFPKSEQLCFTFYLQARLENTPT